MSELYQRVLMWHKMICQTTGGLALCSAKHRLNREEASRWVTYLRDAADDIQTFLDTGQFVLDSKGQRVVKSATAKTTPEPQFFSKEGEPDEVAHPKQSNQTLERSNSGATSRKIGGLRVATRRKT